MSDAQELARAIKSYADEVLEELSVGHYKQASYYANTVVKRAISLRKTVNKLKNTYQK